MAGDDIGDRNGLDGELDMDSRDISSFFTRSCKKMIGEREMKRRGRGGEGGIQYLQAQKTLGLGMGAGDISKLTALLQNACIFLQYAGLNFA